MLGKVEILNVLCQLRSSQSLEIQPKMETSGDYWPSVKCRDESIDQRNHWLWVAKTIIPTNTINVFPSKHKQILQVLLFGTKKNSSKFDLWQTVLTVDGSGDAAHQKSHRKRKKHARFHSCFW